jgi:hypothetical protein
MLIPPTPASITFDIKRSKDFEGKEALRILEFDIGVRDWTGRPWLYPLEADGHAIGDFIVVEATRGLVVERDSF